MRKIAFVLAVVMLIGICPLPISAEETTPDKDFAYVKAIALLEHLGVKAFSTEKKVTYNSFIDALYIALDGKKMMLDIKALAGLNFSDEYGNNEMTFNDAVKSLVNITGYKIEVRLEVEARQFM